VLLLWDWLKVTQYVSEILLNVQHFECLTKRAEHILATAHKSSPLAGPAQVGGEICTQPQNAPDVPLQALVDVRPRQHVQHVVHSDFNLMFDRVWRFPFDEQQIGLGWRLIELPTKFGNDIP